MRAAAGIFMALFYQTPVMDFILLKEQTGVKRKKKKITLFHSNLNKQEKGQIKIKLKKKKKRLYFLSFFFCFVLNLPNFAFFSWWLLQRLKPLLAQMLPTAYLKHLFISVTNSA